MSKLSTPFSAGYHGSINSTFGGNGAITGVYTPDVGRLSVQINNADQYGGAGGTGQYIVAFGDTPYTLTLTNDTIVNPNGINYFGYWLSALDAGNQVSFYRGNTLLKSLTPGGRSGQHGQLPRRRLLRQPERAVPWAKTAASPSCSSISMTRPGGTFDKVVFSENSAVGRLRIRQSHGRLLHADGRRPGDVDLGDDGAGLRGPRPCGLPVLAPASRVDRVSLASQSWGRAALRGGPFLLRDPRLRSRPMPRFKLTLEYDGAPFVGWQRQENGPSVQATLEDAVFAMTGERVVAHGAGRTDAGVHATGQVAHVDLARDRDPFRLSEGLNAHLVPQPVAVVAAERVGDDFDARRSATARAYVYRVVNRRAPLTLERGAGLACEAAARRGGDGGGRATAARPA